MAAPNGTIWGPERGSGNKMGRIGIKVSFSDTATIRKVTISIYLWTRYKCEDSGNTFKYGWSSVPDKNIGSKNIKTTSNSSWSTTNQVLIESYENTYNKGVSKSSGSASANYSNIEYAGGNGSVSTSFEIPTLASYTISYNANGGNNAPSTQTKWYGRNVNISTVIPNRSGYVFKGWSTSNDQTVEYSPGSVCSVNSNVTLYAVWQANTYTVTYDANGGSGAPSSQTKTHDVSLILSNTIPYRENYTFKGWGISSGTTTVSYTAGGTYTDNVSITLYAIWSLEYTEPRITNVSVYRCNSSGVVTETGGYIKVQFSWITDKNVTSIKIQYRSVTDAYWSTINLYSSGSSGDESRIIGGALQTDQSYIVSIYVEDQNGHHSTSRTVGSMTYVWDALSGGKGIAFGKAATREGFECEWDATFNRTLNVKESILPCDYMGKVGSPNIPFAKGYFTDLFIDDKSLVNDILQPTFIPVETDLDSVTKPGVYYGNTGNYINVPSLRENSSFVLEVYMAGTQGQIIQKLTRCNKGSERICARTYYQSAWGAWSVISYPDRHVLWEGAYYMNESQTIKLSESISNQEHGIVLVFSYYGSGSAKNEQFVMYFIPKEYVYRNNGAGVCFNLSSHWQNCMKYLYIMYQDIKGHQSNVGTRTVGGVTYNNSSHVLRYVVGV